MSDHGNTVHLSWLDVFTDADATTSWGDKYKLLYGLTFYFLWNRFEFFGGRPSKKNDFVAYTEKMTIKNVWFNYDMHHNNYTVYLYWISKYTGWSASLVT